MPDGRAKIRYHVISGTRGTDMDRDEVSGYERCGEAYHPQIEECPSVLKTPRLILVPRPFLQLHLKPRKRNRAPHAQSSTTETPSPTASRDPDAKFNELLAQAREIMKDPEFMEEVMALVRLETVLRKEFGGPTAQRMACILAGIALKEDIE